MASSKRSSVSCIATTKSGASCKAPAQSKSKFCWFHDPRLATERQAARSRGGNHSHPQEAIDFKTPETPRELADLIKKLIVTVVRDKRSPKLLEAVVGASRELTRLQELDRKASHINFDTDEDQSLSDFIASLDNT